MVQAAFLLGALLLSLGAGLLLRLCHVLRSTAGSAAPTAGLDWERAAPPGRWPRARR
ncbi:hypothetical protein C5N14_07480 [Micromonospora sp. MW-13]|uniref:hypothetical protein n=1 Tax=unclassified Micromonospora TaxID=2617518 RepID=UPI000EB8B141|nr:MULTISPECIES: hypothetical protein [unclassified Micromonospora]MCX4473646.1 hypothetical protein [Micromonospora sp. NBC_01655]RGC70255.1 hypothetical protein C5N14_07480 [Micromonospora sp. MW-13]